MGWKCRSNIKAKKPKHVSERLIMKFRRENVVLNCINMDNPAKYNYTVYIIFLFVNNFMHFYILLFLFVSFCLFLYFQVLYLSHSNSLHFFPFWFVYSFL